MTNVKDIANRATAKTGGTKNWGNTVTVALWIIALSTHLILMPLLIRELYDEFFHGKKHANTLFQNK